MSASTDKTQLIELYDYKIWKSVSSNTEYTEMEGEGAAAGVAELVKIVVDKRKQCDKKLAESRALSIGDIPFFGLHQDPNNNVTSRAFTLTQMATHLQILSDGLSNDDVGRNVVEEITNRVDANLHVVKNKEKEQLKSLPPLSWSVKQRPDVAVFMEQNGV